MPGAGPARPPYNPSVSVRAVHLVTRLNVGGIARYLQHARDAVDLLLRGRVEPGEREAYWEAYALKYFATG